MLNNNTALQKAVILGAAVIVAGVALGGATACDDPSPSSSPPSSSSYSSPGSHSSSGLGDCSYRQIGRAFLCDLPDNTWVETHRRMHELHEFNAPKSEPRFHVPKL